MIKKDNKNMLTKTGEGKNNFPSCDQEGCEQKANRAVIIHGETDTLKKYCIAHVPRGVALFDIFSLEPLA